MGLKVYIDGKLVEQEQAAVSVFDHGLLYGDGIFEGIRAYNGTIFKADEHIKRLYNSAKAIMLRIPMEPEEFKKAMYDTMAANNLSDAYIRVVVTRGPGDLGLDPRKCPTPSIIIITADIQLYPEEFYRKGLDIVTVSTRRVNSSALSPRIKSCNYLNNIMAKLEGIRAGCVEALMLNSRGEVAECTGDNIFIVDGGVLSTPPLDAGILGGITRDVVIKIARGESMPVRESPLTVYELYVADECFLTGSAAEIVPVVCIDGRQIGDGTPGKTTLQLLAKFRQLTSEG